MYDTNVVLFGFTHLCLHVSICIDVIHVSTMGKDNIFSINALLHKENITIRNALCIVHFAL